MPYIYKMSNAGGMSTVTRYTDMLAGNTAFVPSSYESIATTTVGAGGVSTLTFSSIPQTYTHLQIRASIFQGASIAYFAYVTPGAIAASQHRLSCQGSGVASTAYASGAYDAPFLTLGQYITLDGTYPTVSICDILDYTNTNKNKTIKILSGIEKNGSGEVGMGSAVSLSTAAISSLTIGTYGGTIGQYSSFALYGIKG
jgi:hypothetical protein